jgi:hypothetical protein
MTAPTHPCLARRRLLRGVALAAGVGGAVLPLAAARADDPSSPAAPAGSGWHKFSKKVAGYVDRDRGGPESCGMCHYFLDPDQCVIVEGPISPRGWCNYGATTG